MTSIEDLKSIIITKLDELWVEDNDYEKNEEGLEDFFQHCCASCCLCPSCLGLEDELTVNNVFEIIDYCKNQQHRFNSYENLLNKEDLLIIFVHLVGMNWCEDTLDCLECNQTNDTDSDNE